MGAFGGVGPLPWGVIDRYASRYGITGSEFETLLTVIRKLDEVWLEHLAEQAKAKEQS